MSSALTRLTGRRAWYIPSIAVSGDYSAAIIHLLVSETDDGAGRVVFYSFPLGGDVQDVRFDSLIDHRKNRLPSAISQPVVIPIPRNAVPVAVVGRPSDSSVRLARTVASGEDGIVDLWIIETGYGIQ